MPQTKRDSINKQKYDKRFVICIKHNKVRSPKNLKEKNTSRERRRREKKMKIVNEQTNKKTTTTTTTKLQKNS